VGHAGDVPGQILPVVTGHHWSHPGLTQLYQNIKVRAF
jgi:hypothetical protein